jgi:LytS/YehU family sensor histidine kinase
LIRIAAGYFASITYYLLIVPIFFFHIYLIRYLRKEKELTQAKLNALLMQLRPHFLFNTLHSINTLIDIEPKAAQNMVTKLGSLLRKVIQSDSGHLITFEEELSFIKNHLDIEQVRFQDRLQIYYSIQADSLQAKIPKLILQPMVENTIKHGISTLSEQARIDIKSELVSSDLLDKTYLLINIKDNGQGFDQNQVPSDGGGIGLKNVLSRLQQHYPDDFTFSIDSYPAEGTNIQIKIPFEKNQLTYD